jgi:hypothetical protein
MAPLSEQLLSLRTPAELRDTTGEELDRHITKVILKELGRTTATALVAGDDKTHPDLLEVSLMEEVAYSTDMRADSNTQSRHFTIYVHAQCSNWSRITQRASAK